LKSNSASTSRQVRTTLKAVTSNKQTGSEKALARMGLENPTGLKERLMQRLLRYALDREI
jgi:hypothetical protein